MTSRLEENPLLASLSSGEPTEVGILGEEAFETGPSPKERVGWGLRRLRILLLPRIRRRFRINPPAALARIPSRPWTILARTARRLLIPTAILLGLVFLVWIVLRFLDLFR
jgi:hypothetical protein